MKIILYKPGHDGSFRLYTHPRDVMIDMDLMEVRVCVSEGVYESWNLIKRHALAWSDETKNCSEVIVKLDVEEYNR